jgi:hypothetical protein
MMTTTGRYFRNLLTTRFALTRTFPVRVLDSIERAIKASETRHGGEIGFAIETSLDLPALIHGTTARDRAIKAFSDLRIWDTAANNGVLIYILLAEKDIEIVADRGFEPCLRSPPADIQREAVRERLAAGNRRSDGNYCSPLSSHPGRYQ